MRPPFIPFWKDVQLEDKIFWGKHKGKRIWQVIEQDRGWIDWATEHITNFYLSETAHAYLMEQETKPYGIDFKSILALCQNQKVLMVWFRAYKEEVLASEELKQIFKQREKELKAK